MLQGLCVLSLRVGVSQVYVSQSSVEGAQAHTGGMMPRARLYVGGVHGRVFAERVYKGAP